MICTFSRPALSQIHSLGKVLLSSSKVESDPVTDAYRGKECLPLSLGFAPIEIGKFFPLALPYFPSLKEEGQKKGNAHGE